MLKDQRNERGFLGEKKRLLNHHQPTHLFSFRDKVLGENGHVQRREKTDLIGHNLFKIEYVDGNKLKSHCYIDENMV